MGTIEEVRVARRTGFCYGVREAIDYAKLAAAQGKTTHTLGQVVHNAGVIADLESKGIQNADSLDDVADGAAVVIRAHGVTPGGDVACRIRGLEVIDGTCTWVLQEQKELDALVDEGYTIVLLGTPNHPEVIGLLGHAPDAILVDEEEDWDLIPRTQADGADHPEHAAALEVREARALMVSRAHELKIINTVCPVTIRRQQDTMDLAQSVDLVVVVGGRTAPTPRS